MVRSLVTFSTTVVCGTKVVPSTGSDVAVEEVCCCVECRGFRSLRLRLTGRRVRNVWNGSVLLGVGVVLFALFSDDVSNSIPL